MKKRIIFVALSVLLLLVILFLLTAVFRFPISAANRDRCLREHQASQLSAIGAESADTAQLLADRTDGSLEIQLWQITANGQLHYDVVVWQCGITGNYRIVYATWIAQEDLGGDRISFGFQHNFYWHYYAVTSDFRLTAPRKTFHLFWF